MKILLVSWSTLPSKGGSSIIVENLAKNFTRDEMVVLGSRQPFQKIRMHRPSSGPEFIYFPSELYLMGKGYRYFIWFRKWRFKPLVRYIQSVIEKEQIDHVIGVYPNPFYCHAAALAANEMQVGFSSYFHNTYIENKAIVDPNAGSIQQEIFDASANIFVMSDGMKSYYGERYGSLPFRSLVHTFDQYPSPDSYSGLPGHDKEMYRLVAIGNFNESNIDATKRLVETIKVTNRFRLSVYTHVPKLLLQKRGVDVSAIDYKGYIDPQDIHKELQQYDICVLTHGFSGGYGEIEYRTIFPTRTIPFLLSGKPIFAHSPSNSFLNEFIKTNRCAELVEEPNKKAILAGLKKIASDASYQQTLVRASKKTAEQFFGPNVAQNLKTTLATTQY